MSQASGHSTIGGPCTLATGAVGGPLERGVSRDFSYASLILQLIRGGGGGVGGTHACESLRHDAVFGTLLGKLEPTRRADCAALAGKSTLNRLELHECEGSSRYHKIRPNSEAIERLWVDVYPDAHREAPREIILDLDATDDPLHGHQEGRFFHGYYDGYCYLPLYIFAGEHLLCAKLRRSNIDGAAGAREEVARIVGQIRERWSTVKIILRADSGFCRVSGDPIVVLFSRFERRRFLREGKERISESTLNAALKRMGYKDQLTGHGIRATISTALNELGYREKWVGAQLSHADPNQVSAAYNHAEYVEQRRQMMQDWADRIDQWERAEQLGGAQIPVVAAVQPPKMEQQPAPNSLDQERIVIPSEGAGSRIASAMAVPTMTIVSRTDQRP